MERKRGRRENLDGFYELQTRNNRQGDVAEEGELETLTDGSNADALHVHDHGNITGLTTDPNPHEVTFAQSVTQEGGSDVTLAELEELTDTSTTQLHTHDLFPVNVTFADEVTFTADDIGDEIHVLFADFKASTIFTTSVYEYTADAGVTVDGLLIKDSGIPEAAVTAHEAALTILEGQITGASFANWDTAFGWGDHSAGGYVQTDGSTDITGVQTAATFNSSVFDPVLEVDGSSFIKIADVATSIDTAIGIGALSSYGTLGGNNNFALGGAALNSLTTGAANTVVGSSNAINITTGTGNTSIGSLNLTAASSATSNTLLGGALLTLPATLNYNTVVGSTIYGGFGVTLNNSTIVGYGAGGFVSGSNNILIGYQAGNNLSSGATNLVIGYDVDAPSATASNQMTIGNLLFGTGLDGTGTTISTGNIGIGVITPSEKLEVDGNAVLADGAELRLSDTGDSNYVGFKAPALTGNQIYTMPVADGAADEALVTNGSGVMSWKAVSSIISITPTHDLVFEGTLDSTTQDANTASPGKDFTWNDATEHADITHTDGDSEIIFDEAGEYDIYFNIEVTDATGTSNSRRTFAVYIDHLDTADSSYFEYNVSASQYIRGNPANYDSALAAGHFNLVVAATDKIIVRSIRLDTENVTQNMCMADNTKSYLRIMRKTYV